MIILYNKKQLRASLVFGLLWIGLGVCSVIFSDQPTYFAFIAGAVYLVDYFVRSQKQYALITDEFVQVNKFSAERIYVQDIVEVKYFAGDYTIKSKDKKLVIDTNVVDKESVGDLKMRLDALVSR